nr:MAG TPA: hypothetical protein [Caudoviricetes sp.]
MCKKYYTLSLKEVFIDSPRYKYKVISRNKQSRSLLRKMKSFILPYEYLEQMSPESNEFIVKFKDFSAGKLKVDFNNPNVLSCGYIGFGIPHPTQFGEFNISPEDLFKRNFKLNNK